jgi:hypothetical protein
MYNFLFIFAIVIGLLSSCNSDHDEIKKEKKTDAFQYSIIIKDSIGNELLGGKPSEMYQEEKIKLINLTQDYVNKLTFSIEKYENENRILVKTKCNEDQAKDIIMVLELLEIKNASTASIPDKYTYDTIYCEMAIKNDSLICSSMKVNNKLFWVNDNNSKEEPCISLTKNEHKVIVGGLE